MNKETLRKAIPYVVLVIGVVAALFSFANTQGFENECNEHWAKQIEDYKEYVEGYCPTLGLNKGLPFIVFNSEKNFT